MQIERDPQEDIEVANMVLALENSVDAQEMRNAGYILNVDSDGNIRIKNYPGNRRFVLKVWEVV